MMTTNRFCPICDADSGQAVLFMSENIDPKKLSGFSFASRKVPEYMCHHLVRCRVCDVVYADTPPPEEVLANAYHEAEYDSAEEADDAASAYAYAIEPILRRLPRRHSALEIGTGTGVFLEHLVRAGFKQVTGVEPSSAAIAAAPEERRSLIRQGMFREGDFNAESFDLVCCFMTMEHVRDPKLITQAVLRLLRPGGAFVVVTHDYRSMVNRLLGRRSPIIDIEHLQLFSPDSLRYLFESSGYQGIYIKAFSNKYSMRYWLRLAPLPAAMKEMTIGLLRILRADRLKLKFNVGNSVAAGFKPGS